MANFRVTGSGTCATGFCSFPRTCHTKCQHWYERNAHGNLLAMCDKLNVLRHSSECDRAPNSRLHATLLLLQAFARDTLKSVLLRLPMHRQATCKRVEGANGSELDLIEKLSCCISQLLLSTVNGSRLRVCIKEEMHMCLVQLIRCLQHEAVAS